jgi:hypothetical protein
MKIVKISILLVAAMLCLASFASGAQRMVLGESYTNTSCVSCPPADTMLDRLAITDSTYLAVIRYHNQLPSNSDPFYIFNIPDVTVRNNYYNVGGDPFFQIDGTVNGGTYGFWASLINTERSVTSELEITLSGRYLHFPAEGSLYVRIHVQSDPGLANCRLRVALTEDDIYYYAPNGITTHNQTFRDMLPSPDGQPITLTVGQTIIDTIRFSTVSPEVIDNLNLIAFVQSDFNKRVVQCATIKISDLLQEDVSDNIATPRSFALSQNYPNPFNAQTRIDFSTDGGNASLEIFNIIGAKIATVVDRNFGPGSYSVIWDGRDQTGRPISSGTYFYRLTNNGIHQTMRMTMLK